MDLGAYETDKRQLPGDFDGVSPVDTVGLYLREMSRVPLLETEEELNLALRFALSQPNVVTGICPSFFDLLDKSIEAGKSYRPITEDETAHLASVAKTCESHFIKEQQVSNGAVRSEPTYFDSPHEGCPCRYV